MKYIFVFLTFVISLNSIAQSKKEQIAILTARLDSLNKEYVKDTTYLSNTVETRDREYTIISMQYDEAQEQLKKKSATITDKSNTIKSLNAKNMGLMQERKELNQTILILKSKMKAFKDSLSQEQNIRFIYDGKFKLYFDGKVQDIKRGERTSSEIFDEEGEGWEHYWFISEDGSSATWDMTHTDGFELRKKNGYYYVLYAALPCTGGFCPFEFEILKISKNSNGQINLVPYTGIWDHVWTCTFNDSALGLAEGQSYILSSGNYVNGYADGIFKKYNYDGSVDSEHFYSKGEFIRRRCYEDGKEITCRDD